MKPVRLIVNADDLGASPAVNDATFALIEQGLVTSATLIANAPYVVEACEQMGRFPECSFGIHLNLTEYFPLSDSPALEPLLDDKGEFAGEERIRAVKIDSSLRRGIFEEFASQIERLLSLGATVEHIDSHHHVHNIPRVFPELKRIQKRFQIRKVRISRNIYGVDEQVSRALKLKKSAFNWLLRRYFRTKTTQGFSDFLLFHQNAMSGRMEHRTFEAMVHPGNTYYSEEEVKLLTGSWRDTLDIPVELISYRQLG